MDPYQGTVGVKEISSELDDINTKSEYVETKLLKIAISFVLFCTLLFLCIVNPSPTLKNLWWIPFCAFILVSVPFWLNTLRNIYAWLELRHEHDIFFAELELAEYEMQLPKCDRSMQHRLFKPRVSVLFQRYVYVGAVFVPLFAFSLLMLYAFVFFPRYGNDPYIQGDEMALKSNTGTLMGHLAEVQEFLGQANQKFLLAR